MFIKTIACRQSLHKRKSFILLAGLLLIIISVGFSQRANADACPTARGNFFFMCQYNTGGHGSPGGNGDHPELNWKNSGISQGGNGTSGNPYQVQIGNTVQLGFGYISQEASDSGYHVFSWANIDYGSNSSLFGSISQSGGDANTYIRNRCIDIVFTTDSPYYNRAFETSPGGTVSCNGNFPCDGAPGDNQAGCASSPADPSPGSLVASGSGDLAVWYENSWGGGGGPSHGLNLEVQQAGIKFCMRNHIALTTSGWSTDTGQLANIMRDVRAIGGLGGDSSASMCFVGENPPPQPPPPTCTSMAAFTDPGAADGRTDKLHSASFVSVVDSNGNALVPQGGNPTQTFAASDFYTTGPRSPNTVNTYNAPSYAGTYVRVTQGSTQGPWSYQPLAPNITIYTVREIHNVDSVAHTLYGISIPAGDYAYFPNPQTPNPPFGNDGTINCYNTTIINGTCSLSVSGTGPGGIVVAGGTMYVTATAYNTGPGDLPDQIAGHPLQINNGDYNGNGSDWSFSQSTGTIPHGSSVSVSFTLTAPSSATPYTHNLIAHPAYSNLFAFGPGSDCGTTVSVYVPFSLTGTATVTMAPNNEDPTSISYTTTVCNYSGGVCTPSSNAVDAPVTSKFYGPACAAVTLSQTGPWSPGSTTTLNGSCAPTSLRPGDTYCSEVDLGYTSGYVGPGGAGDIAGAAGPATITSSCPEVENEPYVQFFGSDADAGGGFGTTCTTSPGGIYTYSDAGSPSTGSGTQFGAQALSIIEGFSSAMLRHSAPANPYGLTFANSNEPAVGGNLGVSSFCIPDYYGSMPSQNTALPGGGISGSPGQYAYTSGALPSFGGFTVNNGVNAAIYVNGDVYITNNITYDTTARSQVTDVPSFYLIVKGNIYIAPNVTQLDGVYIAQPHSGSGGVIDTCSTGPTSYNPTSGADLLPTSSSANCGRQLTINGSFIAQQVSLDRAYSSLRYGQAGENPQSGGHNCGIVGSDVPDAATQNKPTCAAEVFDFSPELYLSQPAINPSTGPTTGRFDAITSLSPVL